MSDSNIEAISQGSQLAPGETSFLRALVNSLEDSIVAFDRNGSFFLCNRRFECLFGLNAQALQGHDEVWLRRQLQSCLEAPLTFWEPSDNDTLIQQETVRLMPSYGTKPNVLHWYSGPVLDESGGVMGRIAVQRDITDTVEIDRIKTDFVATVSHELRTPMTSIRGYVDLILDGETGVINDLQRQFLQTVQRNTMRLSAMVNDMLDISRLEAGSIEFDLRALALQGIIEQVVNEVRPEVEAKGLQLTVDCRPVEGSACDLPRVLGDHDRLMQVFINLLSNAIKYTPAPPDSPGRITVDIVCDATRARIAVCDSGIGIDADDIEKLFEKFFRANNAQTRNVDGSGLGLSITRALLENMGSHLRVASQPGQGSEFSFELPLAPRAPKMVTRTTTPVFIIASNGDNVDSVRSRLTGHNDLEAAYSGSEAVRYLRNTDVETIILELLMPHGDAFKVLRYLQVNQHKSQVLPLSRELTRDGQPLVLALQHRSPSELAILLELSQEHGSKIIEVKSEEPGPANSVASYALGDQASSSILVDSVADALAATLDINHGVGLIIVDAGNDNPTAHEQILQLIEVLGAQSVLSDTVVPRVIVRSGFREFLCCWPPAQSRLRAEIQRLSEQDFAGLRPGSHADGNSEQAH